MGGGTMDEDPHERRECHLDHGDLRRLEGSDSLTGHQRKQKEEGGEENHPAPDPQKARKKSRDSSQSEVDPCKCRNLNHLSPHLPQELPV